MARVGAAGPSSNEVRQRRADARAQSRARCCRKTRRAAPSPAAETALGYQLRLTDEQLRSRLQERIAPLGVRLSQWNYLRALWDDDGISQQELSSRASRLGPNTAAALSILERGGFVRRERSKTDRRIVRVYLTAKARAMQDAMICAALDVMAAATAGISEAEIVTLRRVLRKIQKNLAS